MTSSSSSDEDVIEYYEYRRKRRALREYWCHPYVYRNTHLRLFVAAQQLNKTDSKFVVFYRMSKDCYMKLLEMVAPFITKTDTNMRECVGADERLLITLRYLATGDTFVSLSLYFERGETTVGQIVKETTKIIWDVLNEIYMPVPTDEDQWKSIADRFETLWNLPNCIGALDGKHIRIEKFPNTGSENFNYKHFHSTILLACSDADGLFTIIEPGYAGRNSDGGIFSASAMKYWMTNNALNIPSPSPLRYDEHKLPFPYYFVGDEAFSKTKNLMVPYRKATFNGVKRIFNFRLSRGRKTIECVFGMAAEKFAVLNGPIRCHDKETVNDIVKAACVLHNYVRKLEGIQYKPKQIRENTDTEGAPTIKPRQLVIRESSSADTLKNYLANYFLYPRPSLPWQWKYALRTDYDTD